MFVQSDALLLQIQINTRPPAKILNIICHQSKVSLLTPYKSSAPCLVPEMLPEMQLFGITPPKQS